MDEIETEMIPREQYEMAENRTKPIRQHYLKMIASHQSHVLQGIERPTTITDLCAACYLQGLVDAGTALAQTDAILEE